MTRATHRLHAYRFRAAAILLATACTRREPPPSPLHQAAARMLPPAPAILWSDVEGARPKVPRADGAAAFDRYCAPCHGSGEGPGPVGRQLRVTPAALGRGDFKLRSTAQGFPPLDMDLFRTITAGIPPSGMPSFAHLDQDTRWALVDHVRRLAYGDRAPAPAPAVDVGPEPRAQPDDRTLGAAVYAKASCGSCHGPAGRGDGPAAGPGLRPLDFTLGPGAFKGGARPRDVMRTLLTGMPGTPMPSYAQAGLSREELWSLARRIASLAEDGPRDRLAEWRGFFERLAFTATAAIASKLPDQAAPKTDADGCLGCHPRTEEINDKMQPALLALAGGRPGHTCVLCHSGDPDASTQERAHTSLIADPGSLWVVGLGLGCGRCHARPGSLTTFQGLALPAPTGGQLMDVTSTRGDPTGATGHSHAYRVQRSLMAGETGKATRALATMTGSDSGFSDMPVDDPDGPAPTVGSDLYRRWVEAASGQGALRRLDRAESVPAFEAGRARFGDVERAAAADALRKTCLHCHLWDRGHAGGGSRYRAEGCSACHVSYDETGHRLAHRITTTVSSTQCAHCHWSGRQAHFRDLHLQRGIECIDCHTSVDLHGDGNVYTTLRQAVEIACEDCHGTPDAYPWELPVGHGTAVELDGARGSVEVGGERYLLTSRGNVQASLRRRGDAAVLRQANDHERPIPLLKALKLRNGWRTDAGRVAMAAIPAHGKGVSCNACHVPRVARCLGCHLDYDASGQAPDWVARARNRATPFERATALDLPGWAVFKNAGRSPVEPAFARDATGRLAAMLPGCSVTLRLTGVDGSRELRRARFASADLKPVFHEIATPARGCGSCHRGAPAAAPPVDEEAPAPERGIVDPEKGLALLLGRAGVRRDQLVFPKKCPVGALLPDERCIRCHGRRL